jgi:hypothetical protein
MVRQMWPKTCFLLNKQSVQQFGSFAMAMTWQFMFSFAKSCVRQKQHKKIELFIGEVRT